MDVDQDSHKVCQMQAACIGPASGSNGAAGNRLTGGSFLTIRKDGP
jgi:hypothetical protein